MIHKPMDFPYFYQDVQAGPRDTKHKTIKKEDNGMNFYCAGDCDVVPFCDILFSGSFDQWFYYEAHPKLHNGLNHPLSS